MRLSRTPSLVARIDQGQLPSNVRQVDISVEEGCNAHFPSARPIAQWMDSIDQPSQVSTFCLREREIIQTRGSGGVVEFFCEASVVEMGLAPGTELSAVVMAGG